MVWLWVGLCLLWASFGPTPALGQGNIFGTVKNADLTSPPAGQLSWVGFLDGTDDEIRIESNIGAGYDGANWYDDFQNYTTEAAGNPYDFLFVNSANGQSYHLAGPIPANGFQQEDVILAAGASPAMPSGLVARIVGTNRIRLSWNAVVGAGLHIYRRTATNNGIFRRMDNPVGNLGNVGVADTVFVDSTWDGITNVVYLGMSDDGAGHYSAHSAEIVPANSTCDCHCHADPTCDGVTDVLDVVGVVNEAFRGGLAVADATCPHKSRDDFNCDCVVDVLDVVLVVTQAFRGGTAAVCDPCQHPCR